MWDPQCTELLTVNIVLSERNLQCPPNKRDKAHNLNKRKRHSGPWRVQHVAMQAPGTHGMELVFVT